VKREELALDKLSHRALEAWTAELTIAVGITNKFLKGLEILAQAAPTPSRIVPEEAA
jgi:hypothetical protein